MVSPSAVELVMHKHLRAWRLYRKFSLEQVGNILGKTHTTVSRWERGLMKLSTEDLEALASVYQASMRQLMAPPLAADLVATLDRAQGIIEGLNTQSLEQWLAIGETLSVRPQKE